MHVFYDQVHEFCRLMHQELARRVNTLPATPASTTTALVFAEKFLLCPTAESAKACIQRDFPGALGFASALDGVNQRIRDGGFELPAKWPAQQTKFYVLSCAVQDYLHSLCA
jgi:hypothetical protein